MLTKRERNIQENRRAAFIVFVMIFLLKNGHAVAAGSEGAVFNMAYGTKSLDSYWKPTDSQSEWGVSLIFFQPAWPLNFEMGFLTATSDQEILRSFFFLERQKPRRFSLGPGKSSM